MELVAGKKAPAFSLPSDSGEKISLSSLAGKAVVLYFYPKDSTPGCTQESCDFGASYREIQKLGAVVLGVSRDSLASHQKFKAKYGFPFPLLSDEDGKVCEKYGVWKEKSLYGRKFMGIERTTFLIGPDGKLLKVYPKVKVKGHVQEVLEDLKALH
ncbi:MAG: hypothetical protein RJB38_1114 [Pseudomonadota bacterium]|jgi:peroxiredoxin Q/BCP